MAMDMLEHETYGAASSIATRGTATLLTFGDDGTNEELTTSFLCKRMEIDFIALADLISDDATGNGNASYCLGLHKTSVANSIDTFAEQLDARMTDRDAHQQIIWRRYFSIFTYLIDDADNSAGNGNDVVFKTSKSFSKGFRFDKDETYQWVLFNPTSASIDIIAERGLMVRYWGVNVN